MLASLWILALATPILSFASPATDGNAGLHTLERRDFTTIQNDLKRLNTDCQACVRAINNWDGTINGAIPIQNCYNAVDNDIKETTTDANNSAVITAAQAQTLIDYINKYIEPCLAQLITATINKKSQYAANGLTGTVCNNLKTLQTDENALGTALLNKTPAAKKSAAQKAQNKVAADITKGINAFC